MLGGLESNNSEPVTLPGILASVADVWVRLGSVGEFGSEELDTGCLSEARDLRRVLVIGRDFGASWDDWDRSPVVDAAAITVSATVAPPPLPRLPLAD